MKDTTLERLKFIGGALIVAAAALIMLPQFVPIAMGIWRIFLMIVIAGGAALAVAYATVFIKRKTKTQVKE